MTRLGSGSLSDTDLVAAMLGTGMAGKNVFRLAEEALAALDTIEPGEDLGRLLSIPGLGVAKACVLSAALELGRRRFRTGTMRLAGPGDAWRLVSHYDDRKQERFIVISLNGAHEALATRVISVGTVNKAPVHPREVFADALTDRAAALIIAHNHPSGRLEASPDDREVTQKLRESGDILGIPILDHIIFSSSGFWSFKENGII